MKRFHVLLMFLTLAFCSSVWAQEPSAQPSDPKASEGRTKAESKGDEQQRVKREARKEELDEKLAHHPTPEEQERIEKQENKDLIFKAVNFVILVGLMIYFLAKPAKEFFESRTTSIRKGMSDAAAAREAAEKRLAEIEQKLAHLNEEIAGLRAESAKEDAVQAEIMRKATEAEGAKILAAAEAEIDVKTRTARFELKAYAAKLAVDLAEERIKSRMTADTQTRLVASFVNDLAEGGKN
jgi:F-type H+-transporting ATPase subunit b